MNSLRLLLCLTFLSGCMHRAEDLDAPLASIQIQDRNGLTETISTPERLEPYRHLDFLTSQPYKKIIRVFKQNGKMEGKITTYHTNGQIFQYLESQDMRAFGPYKEWHPNGTLKIEAQVIGGSADVASGSQRDWIFDKTARVWDEQGRLIAEIPYEKGLLQGDSLIYDTSGQLVSRSSYARGSLEGAVLEYYPNGSIRSLTTYLQGTKNGESFGYWENGEYCWKENYQNGPLLDGVYYSKQGEMLCKVDSGFGFQALFKNGSLDQLIEFRRGFPEGIVRAFLPNGELKSIYHIKNGRKQGEEIQYFTAQEQEAQPSKEPIPKLSIPWEADRISGTVKTWYNNGKLESQRELSRNKKNGSALGWYKDGSLMYMEEYEEDVLTKGQYFKKNQKECVSSIFHGNGFATLFDDQGIFLRKVQYAKGKPVDPE